ncbi:MAG: cyanophycinase, partial [Pseudomonadales bacterium]|nr:cyanophycinase [Pseudomonadales bacterium]
SVFIFLLAMAPHLHAAKGKLLIVGGALGADNQSVYQAFINNLPSAESKIAIVPAASGKPVTNANKFRQDLIRYGVSAENIFILPLAVRDDPNTKFDESSWRDNAAQPALARQLQDIDGFWFVGGDQMRILDSLLDKPKQPSRLYKAMLQRLNDGALIGGTSAGAAMMSHPMIAAGDSFSALSSVPAEHYYGMESQEYGALYLHHGLGFFPYGIIDQHFDRKARLGRLIRSLSETGIDKGYAVDEDTGMLIDLHKNTLEVVGMANVTIVNAKQAQFSNKPFSAKNLSLSLLAPGDRYDLSNDKLIKNDDTASTVGNEYASGEPHQGAGLALPNHRLDQLLGYELLDNAKSEEVRRYSFLENGKGFRYRFRQVKDSDAYWRYRSGARDQYTILGVKMDIEPVSVAISER